MKLYEIVNGFIGYSHTRVYAWAKDEAEALVLAREKFKVAANEKGYEDSYYNAYI